MRLLIGLAILWLVRPALGRCLATMDTADARRLRRLDPADVARWPVR